MTFPLWSFGQTDDCEFQLDSLTGEKIYTRFDQAPNIGGSDESIMEYISSNFEWPHHYTDSELLIATFIVRQNGEIDQIEIYQKSQNEFANENFMKLIKNMPKWNPALCDGMPVTAKYYLPLKLGITKKEK